jgi:hypothetical protein
MLIFSLLLLCTGPTLARGSAEVTPQQLLDNPKRYDSKLIVVRRIRCVDPGATGFVCEATAANRRLRLDGTVLGSITEPAIAEKLIGPCKGVAALIRPTCTFDVVLTPTGSEIEDGITVIHAQEIDLVKPRRP